MAAPSGIVWGSTVGNYGRIGIYKSLSNSNTETTVTVEVWFWSKYSASDSNNTFYFDNLSSSGSATTSKGSVKISTTVATGDGWSTSNQQRIASYTYGPYTRGTSAVTRYLYAKLVNIDIVGSPMYASTTFSVPKLTSYTIKYNANGGSGAPSAQTKWYGKSLTLSSTKPTRSGYSFQGWALTKDDADNGTWYYQPGGTCGKNENLTLYAVWKANTYTIKYDANGGSGAPSNQTKTYGVALTLSSTKPTRTNYTFKGWGTSASATTVAYAAGASYTVNAGATLYAIWDLAYIKPRINNLSVDRCDSSGTLDEEGLNALVIFDWECDQNVSSIVVEWKLTTETSWTSKTFAASGTANTANCVVGDDTLDLEQSYDIKVTVTDSIDSSNSVDILPSMVFAMDALPENAGVAFGKTAELEGVCDIAYQTRFFGGILYPVLEPDTDLNDVRIPNTYTGANVMDNNYVNCPVTSGTFTLLVESCGEEGQVKQTYTSCSKHKPEVYARFYYQEVWGKWFWASTDEVVLYENSDGTDGTITLAHSAANYRYLEIYFGDNNIPGTSGKYGGYTKVWNPNGKTVGLHIAESAAAIYYRQTLYTISGSTLTPNITNASYVYINTSGSISVKQGTNYIKIVRVVGRA